MPHAVPSSFGGWAVIDFIYHFAFAYTHAAVYSCIAVIYLGFIVMCFFSIRSSRYIFGYVVYAADYAFNIQQVSTEKCQLKIFNFN